MSDFLGDIGESGDSSETDLQRFIFAQIEDAECGVVGWRFRQHSEGLHKESTRLFDSSTEALLEGIKDMVKADQSPIQSPESYIETTQDCLLEAVGSLTLAHHLLESTGVSKRYTTLFTAVCDALNAASAAVEHCDDKPDQ